MGEVERGADEELGGGEEVEEEPSFAPEGAMEGDSSDAPDGAGEESEPGKSEGPSE
jgi:hypothetical protein